MNWMKIEDDSFPEVCSTACTSGFPAIPRSKSMASFPSF